MTPKSVHKLHNMLFLQILLTSNIQIIKNHSSVNFPGIGVKYHLFEARMTQIFKYMCI